MATHGLWQSHDERIGRLEATIESLISENERLRTQVANAHEAEEILRRAQAPPLVPPPRRTRHRTPAGKRWLRVIPAWLMPAAALALSAILAGALPIVRADDTPVRADVIPNALCDPDGFAPPSQDGIWQLMMTRGSGPCIEIPPAFIGR